MPSVRMFGQWTGKATANPEFTLANRHLSSKADHLCEVQCVVSANLADYPENENLSGFS